MEDTLTRNRDLLPAWLQAYAFAEEPQIIHIAKHDVLFHQNSFPDGIFLILAGSLSVHQQSADNQSIEIDNVHTGQFIGEMGAANNQLRTATVVASEQSILAKMSAFDYANIVQHNAYLEQTTPIETSDRWKRLQLSGVLDSLFGGLAPSKVHDLQKQLIWRNIQTGDILCQQNDPAHSMFVIVSGRLQFFTIDADGQTNILGHAEAGETVGEYALITDIHRSATIRAVRESVVIEISKDQYQTLSQKHPQLIANVAKIIVERQLRTIGHLPPKNKKTQLNIAVIATDPSIDITPFLTILQFALETYGKAKTIRAKDLNNAFGEPDMAQVARDDPRNTAITQWLNEQETNSDFLLFSPDENWSIWTQRCIGQADKILLVGKPTDTADVTINEIEKQINLQNLSLNQELVLWHDESTDMPSGTLQWLEQRPHLQRHHHIRANDINHFKRLARLITGNGIGLVLSGGGARGFVHLGVIKAMNELNIPIDYVGGTSFGASMAGTHALGMDEKNAANLFKEYSRKKYIHDRTFPLVAMNKSEGIVKLTKGFFGDVKIEDMWIPYFAIATNLSKAKVEVIDRGPLWLANRKSVAVPGLYTPVFENGNVFVDGGVINNFPVGIMAKALGNNRIIGISVLTMEDETLDYDMGHSVSGWKMLFEKLNPLKKSKKPMPSMSSIIMRTMDVNSILFSRETAKLADLVMVIRAQNHGFLEFDKYAEIIKIGYNESFERLKAWKEQQEDL